MTQREEMQFYPGERASQGFRRQLFNGMCAGCHALRLISNSSGYTREHWRELIGSMVDLSGSKAQQDEVLDRPHRVAVCYGSLQYLTPGACEQVLASGRWLRRKAT